jgi:predicted molibdopterin-dependent oxidoreductase YjgC
MDYKNVLTTCVYCGSGCTFYFEVLDGEIVGVLPDKTHPISQGRLCIKGWNAQGFVQHPDRLTAPLIRRDGELQEATWEEALATIGDKLAAIRDESGPDSIGFFTSAKCTNEENYLFQKFARAVIGTNNVDHCARL